MVATCCGGRVRKSVLRSWLDDDPIQEDRCGCVII